MSTDQVSVKVYSSKALPTVSFVNGKVRNSKKRRLKISLLEETAPKHGKKRKIVVAESDKLTYQGKNFGPLVNSIDHTKLYVAAVSKMTGQMKLYPTEIFNLHPFTKEDLQREQVPLESMSFREKADLLTDAFGSGKQKRALARRQRNKMAEGAVLSAMGSVLDSAVRAEKQMPSPVIQEASSAIPPYNKDAKTPDDVYSLNNIIGPAELESLKNSSHVFFHSSIEKITEWQQQSIYFSAVLSRLGILPVDEIARWRYASCLMYLQHMMKLFLMKAQDLKKKDSLPKEWPDLVRQLLLDRFTIMAGGPNSRCIPGRLKDLLLSHILVLCLILDQFVVDLTSLQNDLKLSAKKLHTHVRALGCKVKCENTKAAVKTYTAHLTVPLTFPQPSKGRKEKK